MKSLHRGGTRIPLSGWLKSHLLHEASLFGMQESLTVLIHTLISGASIFFETTLGAQVLGKKKKKKSLLQFEMQPMNRVFTCFSIVMCLINQYSFMYCKRI